MKVVYIALLALLVVSCGNDTNSADQATAVEPVPTIEEKPKVSFTFDDGITTDQPTVAFEDWNQLILTALEEAELKAVFFVTGANKLDERGKHLLASWSEAGHVIANHTYTHPNFNNEEATVAKFEQELLRTDAVISSYATYRKLFRFPYLKEGNTEEKIAGYRAVLQEQGYRNGYVTIDASDWFVNGKLVKYMQEHGDAGPKIEDYRTFYLQHILERANYYEDLAFELTGRHIPHTLLLHHNLTSALFLEDLIQLFKEKGWEVMDAEEAFQDNIFAHQPNNNPAGESLIWALAKESGDYEDFLRYPAEDSRYEVDKMEELGL